MSSQQTAVEQFIVRQPLYNRLRYILHAGLRFLFWLLWRGDVTGLEHVPKAGGVILMMNHATAIDPVVCTRLITHRYVITMAKIETLKNPVVWFFNGLWGNFVVKRGEVDRFALNSSIELLQHGQIVLIAPEGTRNRDGLKQPREGIAYIAAKAEVVIVPAVVVGADDWLKRLMRFRRVYSRVHFGRAFRFKLPANQRMTRNLREQMMQEAMYQLALAIPDEYAHYRGDYQTIANATTETIEFV
jgi:1-acyl-sn-glycerol-3-phosphate acyltransferase